MKPLNFLIIAGLLISAVGTPAAAEEKATEFAGLRARWATVMGEFDVPGMAVAVVKDGRVAAIETFGVRGPGKGAPSLDTMFYIASITKTYLATAVCALADDGKLKLDDPVQKYLPRVELGKRLGGAVQKISIRDLLSHHAGIVDAEPIVVLDAFTGEITEDRFYNFLSKAKPKFETRYSNVHFTLLGRVVEAVSGKPWQEYLKDRVLQPAGLTRTTSSASELYDDADCAMPLERDPSGGGDWRVCKLRKTDRTMHAAGGLATSARDAARYLLLHLNDGEIDGKRVISPERAKEMRTTQSKFAQKQGGIRVMEGYGLGWQTGSFHGTPLCSHGGGYVGATTYYAMLPDKKSGFAILINGGEPANLMIDVVAVDILDRLIDGDEHVDVLEGYRNRVREFKEKLAARDAKLKEELAKPLELSRPQSVYAGKFKSDSFGTMTVAADGPRLKVALGECELDVAPAGRDGFRVLGPTLSGADFRFVVSPAGEVTGVRFDGGGDDVLFER